MNTETLPDIDDFEPDEAPLVNPDTMRLQMPLDTDLDIEELADTMKLFNRQIRSVFGNKATDIRYCNQPSCIEFQLQVPKRRIRKPRPSSGKPRGRPRKEPAEQED